MEDWTPYFKKCRKQYIHDIPLMHILVYAQCEQQVDYRYMCTCVYTTIRLWQMYKNLHKADSHFKKIRTYLDQYVGIPGRAFSENTDWRCDISYQCATFIWSTPGLCFRPSSIFNLYAAHLVR